MNASSMPNVHCFRRMNVLNDTATRESPRNMNEMTMMASGKPLGAINLAEGSMPSGDPAIVEPDRHYNTDA
jgi:hypothetical protein